ncbi:rhodanese-like domain-containing protein [candidate division KSB1 bacterium]|nr:rhodanese-like domain-containing protein [candidate division KSB1 bacterium]
MSFASLLGIVLLAFVALLLLRQIYFKRQVRHFTPEEVTRKLKFNVPLVFLDVRTTGENRQGQIPDSLNIPLHELSSRLPELEPYRHREIVVYCATGTRSVIAAHFLQKHGFSAANLRGGFVAWRANPNI